MSKRALGKGIGALLGEEEKRGSAAAGAAEVPLSALRPNPSQPRKDFADARLQELADSIRQKGVLQPVLVEDDGSGRYTIIAGERRYRAARLAGLEKIPVIVGRFADDEKLEIALIENVQREDLTPIEEAQAYRRLMEMGGLSQEQVAAKVGKDRSTVANSLAPAQAARGDADGHRSGRHEPRARAGDPHGGEPVRPAAAVPAHHRAGHLRARGGGSRLRDEQGPQDGQAGGRERQGRPDAKPPELRELEQKLIEKLGTKVEIKGTGRKGRVEIAYYSADDLDRLLELLKIRT